MDEKYELYLSFHSYSCLGLRIGCTLSLMNIHLLKNVVKKAAFVACHYSQISLLNKSLEECTYFHISKNRKKDIQSKYPNIESLLLARRIKGILTLLDCFESEMTSCLTRDICDALVNLNHSNNSSESKDPKKSFILHPIHDFILHKETYCPILMHSECIPILWTWKELESYYESQFPLETIKGTCFKEVWNHELGISPIFLIGIASMDSFGNILLESNGKMKIWIHFMSSMNSMNSMNESHSIESLKETSKDFSTQSLNSYIMIIKRFKCVIETFGYLSHLINKVYIITYYSNVIWIPKSKTNSNSLQIHSKNVPEDALLFKITYKRPISIDVTQFHSHIQAYSCIEGIIWKLDEFERPDKGRFGLVKLIQDSLTFNCKENEFYWISGSILVDESDGMYCIINSKQGLIPFHGSSIAFDYNLHPLNPILSIESFYNHIQNSLNGQNGQNASKSLNEASLFHLKARVVSKSLSSTHPWKLELYESPESLFLEWNIGIGRLDRILVLKCVDEDNLSLQLDIFWDLRLCLFHLGILPGSLIHIDRLGCHLSKSSHKWYGKSSPLTSVKVLELGNDVFFKNLNVISSPPLPTILLNQITEYSNVFQIIGNVISVKKLGFTRSNPNLFELEHDFDKENVQNRLHEQEMQGSATLRISDGSMDAFVDVDSIELVYKILQISKVQIQEISKLLKSTDSLVYNDTQPHSCPLIHDLVVTNVLKPRLALVKCQKRSIPSLKVRTFKSKNVSTSTFAYSALSIKLLEWEYITDPYKIVKEWGLFSL